MLGKKETKRKMDFGISLQKNRNRNVSVAMPYCKNTPIIIVNVLAATIIIIVIIAAIIMT